MQRTSQAVKLLTQLGRGFATGKGDASALIGTTGDILNRKVTIFSPAREAGQSGQGKTLFGQGPGWKISFDVHPDGLWENQLTGWSSTSDPLENVSRMASGLAFNSKEDAAEFCDKHGWSYEFKEPNPQRKNATVHFRNPRYADYGSNFSVKRKGIPKGGLVSVDVPGGRQEGGGYGHGIDKV